MDEQTGGALVVIPKTRELCNKTYQVSAIRRAEADAADYVVHISPSQAKLLSMFAGRCKNQQRGDRNALLIKFLFDSCLRISEALGVRYADLQKTPDGYLIKVLASNSKNHKAGVAAITPSIAAELGNYCMRYRISETERIFKVSRSQAFRIITEAFDKAGISRPTKKNDKVGAVHVFRHSGAIERLRLTGNPKSVQTQLRHRSAAMTLKYLKTLSADESLKIQQGIELW